MAKILLVDDDPLIVRMYQTALSYQGYDIESAENGINALEKIKKTDFDMIIFDVMMPEMSGLDLLTAIKADPKYKNIPTIALTNLAGTLDAEEIIKLGANKYIIK
jgi:CheY-like chemotaxis protein